MLARTTRSLLLIVVLAPLGLAPALAQPPTSPPDNDFILRGSATGLASVLASHGLTEIDRLDSQPAGEDVCLVRADAMADPQQVVDDLSLEPAVNAVEEVLLANLPETYSSMDLEPLMSVVTGALGDASTVAFGTDAAGNSRSVWTSYVDQTAAQILRISEAQSTYDGSGAIVAVIDSGIDPEHPLFAGHLVPGYDFVLDQPGTASEWSLLNESSMAILGESSMAILGTEDTVRINESSMAILGDHQANDLVVEDIPPAFGHGTMVAGIIHRVAPGAKIMPLRAFDGDSTASLFNIVRAIHYAVDNGATVINMSFSLETFSWELVRAVGYALSNGVRLIASVGNAGSNIVVFPAGLLGVFGVASSDDVDSLSGFSNFGLLQATIAAPGENVITAYPGGGWAAASGTSFAAPWVSGAVALFADKRGSGGPGEVRTLEILSALGADDPLYGASPNSVFHERLDIKAALDSISEGGAGPWWWGN